MRKILALSLIPAVLLASCGTPEPQKPNKTVSVVSVRAGSVDKESSFLVTVSGKRESDLAFKASGRIVTVSANI